MAKAAALRVGLRGKGGKGDFISALEKVLGSLAALAFPARCVTCRRDLDWPLRGPICDACLNSFPSISQPFCPRCGFPYPRSAAQGLCGPCQQNRWRFRLARAAGPYEGALRESLLQFKFGGRYRLGSVLGRFAFEGSIGSGELPVPEAVVPVPLNRRRRRERGYNQAELLARAIAKAAGVPVVEMLVKVKDRPPQAELEASRRWRNAAGAYKARIPESLRGKDILLVDDVLTTGATVETCVRALVRSGSGSVDVLTVARVP